MCKQILIINENTEELRKLRQVLSREGYNIMTAMDAQTAIEICENIDVAFILASTKVMSIQKFIRK